jgi:glyoxylase-like metal-dependent hydrolase (beta-lactamase superfamily II)
MASHWLTRRRFVVDLGRTTLGAVVLGAVACGGDDDTTEAPTDGADPTVTTTPTDGAATGQPTAGARWARVDLEFVSAYVIVRGGEAAVVDTGVEGSSEAIEATLGDLGVGWRDVGHVVLTHRHPDHVGSVARVLELAGDATAYAGAGDIDAIRAPRAITPVGDGDGVLGMDVIDTPGHTPGHISLLAPELGLLVAGDALNGPGSGNEGPAGVGGANPDFSDDMEAAEESVGKLADLTFDVVVFGHGAPVDSGAQQAVRELADSL